MRSQILNPAAQNVVYITFIEKDEPSIIYDLYIFNIDGSKNIQKEALIKLCRLLSAPLVQSQTATRKYDRRQKGQSGDTLFQRNRKSFLNKVCCLWIVGF